ncbi:filamentation induced by cAMP protein Fic [Cellulophaga algicola DSM 14237]|uniref:Filamentation induced by cAMP protein Fic n=1 Tax=Cellulophaga algicola (strain DSM 14237 / IC166 / ACAM 630) TaxID=688270 RepID=E6XEV8_CELAD|nr:Fic family protein [Cellulophaga algicola]ADV48160.1 filamentation induced by cAMP protein Fic [Cellulophaga algicola DSM 14237]
MEIEIPSIKTSVFQGNTTPENGKIVGYGAIIEKLKLPIPFPNTLALITEKSKKYNTDYWKVFPASYQPEETLYKQLVFAIKYEGINLLVFKALFNKASKNEIQAILNIEPMGQYSRKIWFLYEWLQQEEINVSVDLKKRKYIPLLDTKIQYAIKGEESVRQKIINNLPGTKDFCPLLFKTAKLEAHINANISGKKNVFLNTIHKDVLQRASSFLLLKDSKASFTIEGENPANNRAMRWGKAIGQAGQKPLSIEELLRLQQIVIENSRFIAMGLRKKGGFVGEHDRATGEPIPDHISAKEEDVEQLLKGLIATNEALQDDTYDAVLAAATIAFGFVFIHPFVDGNGRLHRYIIHHILAKKEFTQQGVIFPVSSSILDHIDDYKTVLESYSHPLLDHIEWKETEDHNVEVTNDTIDLYRYFDATKQAEFLYDCVEDTLERVIPEEVIYLQNYDAFKRYIDNHFEMPDKMVAILVRFLEQNDGVLSKRALKKEFLALTEKEIKEIETNYNSIFLEA